MSDDIELVPNSDSNEVDVGDPNELENVINWSMPCPFCGDEDVLLIDLSGEEDDETAFACRCSACEGEGPQGSTELEAGLKWNYRA